MHTHNLRVCVLGEKFDKSDPRPSGSSILVCASGAFINKAHQTCTCKTHVNDWWGHDHDGRRQAWRNRVTTELLTQFCSLSGLLCRKRHLGNDQSLSTSTSSPEERAADPPAVRRRKNKKAILDGTSPPPSLCPLPAVATAASDIGEDIGNDLDDESYPADARIKQKERLKEMKEQGLKPKKRPKVVEEGTDDCGDSLSGLGKHIEIYTADYYIEDLDEDRNVFINIPSKLDPHDQDVDVFSAIACLCYGSNNCVDVLELCGGSGGISKAAFKRGLVSGGNLDLTTQVNLDDKDEQFAINHYLQTCYVLCVILQPNCRSTGPNSYFKLKANYDTWNKHHQ